MPPISDTATETPVRAPGVPRDLTATDEQRLNVLVGTGAARTVQRQGEDGEQLQPYYVSDQVKQQDTGLKRIPFIYIHCEVGPKDFKKSRTPALHEIPLMKRLHEHAAGDLVIFTSGYAPGLKQVVWKTQQEAQDEFRRLHGDSSPLDPRPPMYVLPSQGQGTEPRNIFHDVYGTGRQGQERFFTAIRDMALAWVKLVQKSESGYAIRPEDVTAIIEIADPRSSVAMIEMPDFATVPDVAAAMAAEAPRATESPGLKDMPKAPAAPKPAAKTRTDVEMGREFFAHLRREDVPEGIALRFATEVEKTKGQPLDEPQWAIVLGKNPKLEERATLTRHLEDFYHPAAVAATKG